jgi:hypothetical protein
MNALFSFLSLSRSLPPPFVLKFRLAEYTITQACCINAEMYVHIHCCLCIKLEVVLQWCDTVAMYSEVSEPLFGDQKFQIPSSVDFFRRIWR